MEHCRDVHGLDLAVLAKRHAMDTFSFIRLVNYIRTEAPSPGFVMALSSSQKWSDAALLRPALPDDPLLMWDFDGQLEHSRELEEDEENGFEIDISRELNDQIANPAAGLPEAAAGEVVVPAARLHEFRQQLLDMTRQLARKEEELKEVVADMERMKVVAQGIFTTGQEEPKVASKGKKRREVVAVADARTVEEDRSYFESYAHYSIHHEMLSDVTRTASYRRALSDNPARMKDALVLDIGCGTGILSMFAARAGAKAVVGVDCSDIVYQAMDIVRENQLEQVVTLVKGRLEELEELPHAKYDVIVSEWMGYFLLFEGMLDSVIAARERFLAPGGTVLPSRCSIHLAALSDLPRYEGLVNYWTDVYGFKMSCMRAPCLHEASVEWVPGEHVVSDSVRVHNLDINTCTVADTEFSSDFVLTITRDCSLTGLVGYFDTFFELEEAAVEFSTGPQAEPTHWKQTVFYLPEVVAVVAGERLEGRMVCRRMETDARALKVALTLGGRHYRYTVD